MATDDGGAAKCERLERERIYWKDAYSECKAQLCVAEISLSYLQVELDTFKARIAEFINDKGGSDES